MGLTFKKNIICRLKNFRFNFRFNVIVIKLFSSFIWLGTYHISMNIINKYDFTIYFPISLRRNYAINPSGQDQWRNVLVTHAGTYAEEFRLCLIYEFDIEAAANQPS